MNLIDVVGKSAPLLGTMLGSPIAGIGISWLAKLFGADPKSADDLANKIINDPMSDSKLKQLEMDHQEELAKIAATDYQTEVDDRKSARLREISLHDFVPTILSVGFLLAYAVVQFYCMTHSDKANDIISARVQDVLIMIVSYYFGSMHRKI